MQIFKVLAFEAILFTFSRMKLSLKSLFKLVEFTWEKLIILGLLRGRSPLPFMKIDKKCSDFGKKNPASVYQWIIQSSRETWKFFIAEPFFCMSYINCLSKCPYSKKPVLPQKIPGFAPLTLILIFHPNFHPNIWVFANLPIYRKLIDDNTYLVFRKPRIICSVLFWRRYKIVSPYQYLR